MKALSAVILLAASGPALAAPQTITAPYSPAHLIRRPNRMELVWPRYAARPLADEHVVLDCVIDGEQRLKPCAVVEQAPKDQGFVQAALTALEPARMAPPIADGAAVSAAHVQITIDYLGDSGRIRWTWIFE